ncbi:hypothetical protein [Helicobacter sp. 13S00477-4]|uniref:hypothetical protein n=1 Tax=Helicobacter sp. 13S00477-4 TaxID=1905759 RepID=UPI000BA58516|nr:hypothetical protein [Helicobacter sp. 13S00477-4]PAF51986.1 hypothetical protein BKH44_04820 [Helicobacter sp. 13S00477-4]
MSIMDYFTKNTYESIAQKYHLKQITPSVAGGLQNNKDYGTQSNISVSFGGNSVSSIALSLASSLANNFLSTISKVNIEKYNLPSSEIQGKLFFLLSFNPFSILANGTLYKEGRAGSDTYNPLTAYEPYKYILGKPSYDEFNDILQGRTHYKLAGNKDYYDNTFSPANWDNKFKESSQTQRLKKYTDRILQINKGYKELDNLGFYVGDINNKNTMVWFETDENHFILEENHKAKKITSFNYWYKKEIKQVTKPIFNNLKYQGYSKKR